MTTEVAAKMRSSLLPDAQRYSKVPGLPLAKAFSIPSLSHCLCWLVNVGSVASPEDAPSTHVGEVPDLSLPARGFLDQGYSTYGPDNIVGCTALAFGSRAMTGFPVSFSSLIQDPSASKPELTGSQLNVQTIL